METVRTIDWVMLVVELLVLLVIVWEFGITEWRHHGEKKRKANLRSIADRLVGYMDAGLKLQGTVPDHQESTFIIEDAWMIAVADWSFDTGKYLGALSQRAWSAFTLIANSNAGDSTISSLSGHYFTITGPLRECYQRLLVQLQNLKDIIERADTYF